MDLRSPITCEVKFSWQKYGKYPFVSEERIHLTFHTITRSELLTFKYALNNTHSDMISSSYKRVHAKNTLTFLCGDVCSCIIITTATCGIFIARLRERVRLKLRVGVHVCQRMYTGLGNVWQIEIEFFLCSEQTYAPKRMRMHKCVCVIYHSFEDTE